MTDTTDNIEHVDKLRPLIDATIDDIGGFLPNVRERILKRIQAAYIMGCVDGFAHIAPSAERRTRNRVAQKMRVLK